MNKKNDRLSELEDVLAESDDLSTDEILSDLKKSGVDTEHFLARARSTMQTRYRAHLRNLTQADQPELSGEDIVFPQVETMDREMMLASLDRIQSGEMGEDCKESILGRYRNKEHTKLTDEELRLLLRDLADMQHKPDDGSQ